VTQSPKGTESALIRDLIWKSPQPEPFARLLMLERLGIRDRKKTALSGELLLRYAMNRKMTNPPPKTCYRGHDLTVPGRLRTYKYHYGLRYSCLECTKENNRKTALKKAGKKSPAICKVCGKEFLTLNKAIVCSGPCQNSYVSKQVKAGMRHIATEAWSQMHAAALLRLHEQRDRCATHWERAEVDALIEAKKREMA
jgi:transcription elongation factor Elf1